MKLKDYLAISGEHGLFKFIAQGRNAIIVEHLESLKRTTAPASAKVSTLEDISIFTEGEDLALGKVFDKIFDRENGGQAPDAKSDPEKLRIYFSEIIPDYDKTRVYPSDIRKVIKWYNILQGLNLLVKEDPEPEMENGKDTDKAEKAVTKSGSKPEEKIKQGPVKKTVRKTTGKTESKSAATKSKGAPKVK
jgi:hypothetical protein